MPLSLRRRQEPKSARRMCPFVSSRTLSGLTSLEEGREREGLDLCVGTHVCLHVFLCVRATRVCACA
jgi:hypothetical protein